MRTWRLAPLALTCMFLLVCATVASAQETRGSIEGIVKDSTGGVLPGVTVQVKNSATAAVQSSVTNGEGAYRFPGLPPGTYSLTATLSGFKEQTIPTIRVTIGDILKANVTMSLAGLTDTATVTAEAPIVDIKQSAVTAKVTADILALLPKGRDFLSALTGIAGTNYESGIDGSRASGIMIDGASQTENRFLIDGQDTTNLRTGASGKDLVVDFIDQIQVKQSGYNAEFRATTGGVVSAITKSGTNTYHGSIAFDYSGKRLNDLRGNVRPGLRLDPNNAVNPAAEYFTTPRTSEFEQETLDPIYEIGGPILKNRAWFWAGYNSSLSNQDRTVQWSNPVSAGVTYPSVQTFNSKGVDKRYLYNSTMQVTKAIRVRFNGNNQRTSASLGLPTVDSATFSVDSDGNTLGISNANPATFNPRPLVHTETYNNSYSGVVDWNIDTRTFASFQVGVYGQGSGSKGGDYFHGIRRVFSGSNVNYCAVAGDPSTCVPAEFQHPSGYADNNVNTFTVKDEYSRFNIGGSVVRYASWLGQHAFKTGFEMERLGNDVNQGQQFPNVSVVWNASRTTLGQQQVRGTYGYYSVVQTYTAGNIHSNNLGLFLQDQWTFNQKLTLNYGARFDRTNFPSYRNEYPGIKFGWGSKIAPRLGFAYDVRGDAKWKMFGSWGIFYDIEKLELPRGSFGADHWVTYYWTLDNYDFTKINCDGTPNSGCPGTYIEQNDLRFVSNNPSDPNHLTIDPNLKPFKAQEFVMGLDHELNRLMSVGTRYVHKWVNNAIEDVGVQTEGIGEVFYIANPGYGFGAFPLGTGSARQPFPMRNYDALEFSFNRRLANNWSVSSNITFSRLFGNYSGLSNSTSESNRNSPNVTRAFDGLYMSFTEEGCPTLAQSSDCSAYGNLGKIATDRPVQFKLQGTYLLPWGTSAGVDFSAFSGNLQTTTVSYKAVPVMIYGPGNVGRTGTYTNTNLNFSQTFRIPRGMRITAQFNITNLFDQDFATGLATAPWRDAFTLVNQAGVVQDTCTTCSTVFFNGFDTKQIMAWKNALNANTGRPDPRYGMESAFRGARTARFYLRLTF